MLRVKHQLTSETVQAADDNCHIKFDLCEQVMHDVIYFVATAEETNNISWID